LTWVKARLAADRNMVVRNPTGWPMNDKERVLKLVRGALERDRRINLHRFPLRLDLAEGAVVLEGEVESLAAKKLALEHAAAVEGIRGVVDRLRVAPAEAKGDGAIRDALAAFLLGVPELRNCTIRARRKGRAETLRQADGQGGEIEFEVNDGAIVLEGRVPSLSHLRIAGVLAWWTPGCRDAVNALEVVPPAADDDEEVIEAYYLVLEMDPLVHQREYIRASCANFVVTLEGSVRSEIERRRAELDAWALFGVDRVENRLAIAS
jgi:osmotically-inducible protein OsmY